MSDSFRTEEEQIEALKTWWQESGKSTLVAIALGVAVVFGWQGWQKQQQAEVEAASAVYQNLLSAVQSPSGELSETQRATAQHLATSLREDYPDSTYAIFAALYEARFAVQENSLDAAEGALRWVLAKEPEQELLLQAKLRLARVLVAKQQYDDAMALLSGDNAGFAALYEELKGDIYWAQDDRQQALNAYQQAQQLNLQAEAPKTNPLLDMKLQQLNSELAANTTTKEPVDG